jgi:Holliday junction resolvase-like predicted endonuclease
MITTLSFQTDAQFGYDAEDAVVEFLRSRGFTDVSRVRGEFGSYDIAGRNCAGIRTTYEIKHDRRSEQSGRVAIEVSFKGRDSGIQTTGADWWVLISGTTAFFARPATIKLLIESKESFPAGDAARIKTIPLRELRQHPAVTAVPYPFENAQLAA